MQRQFMRQMQKMKKTAGNANPVQMMQQKMQADLARPNENSRTRRSRVCREVAPFGWS